MVGRWVAVHQLLSGPSRSGVALVCSHRLRCYLRIYRHSSTTFATAGRAVRRVEDLAEALRACGADPHAVRLSYDHTTAPENTVTVEGYLQRGAFDDSVSLQEMMTASHPGPYLRDCRDQDCRLWRFHHEVDVLLLKAPGFTEHC